MILLFLKLKLRNFEFMHFLLYREKIIQNLNENSFLPTMLYPFKICSLSKNHFYPQGYILYQNFKNESCKVPAMKN